MDIFEITIQHRLETGWPVVAERTRPSQLPLRSEGRLELDEEYESDLLSKQLDARDYGETLGLALFQGTLRDSYMAARAEAEAAQQPLRVLLVVEDPELKPLRWERLCAPDGSGGWDFLALDQRTLYSLYLPSLTDRRFPAIGRRDLRALVVLADPPAGNKYGLTSFDAGATAISIAAALGEIPHDLLGPAPGAVGPATLDALCDRITAGHYTMLHLVAHGQYRKDGETVLFLLDAPEPTAADEPPRIVPVTATELIKRLGRLRGARGLPRLAFLATCESAKPEAEAAMGGLAQRLVRDLGMPAVVAMTERVSIATAERLTQPFYTRLRQHGQADRALVEAGAGLQDRDDILVPALYSRLAGRPLFSDALEEGRSLTDEEIRYGLERLAVLLPERAPVLEEQFAASAKALRALLGSDEQALSKEARKERAQALDDINALSEEVLDLSFPAIALDQPIPDYQANHCPFPGLKAFQVDDEAYFFGRDQAVDTLLKRLGTNRFLAVLGISGSGKSSLVLAGMVPKLRDQAKEAGQTLDYRALTPGADPEAILAKQLQTPLPAGQPALLIIDQFEELFTLSTDPEARGRFLENLLKIGKDNPDLHTILTLRADFWGDCAPFEAFRQQMQAHQELLAPMTLAELRSAMEQQAASVGLRFEADLSHTILAEVEGEPGAMPLLQHLLRELWKRRHGRWLRASEYRKLGGIKKAIAHTADEIYDELVKQESGGEELMRNLFVRLTRLDEKVRQTRLKDKTDGDEQYRDTRQRVPFAELIPAVSDGDSKEDRARQKDLEQRIRRLIQRLADARLLVTTTDKDKQNVEVEVSHEALIRHWPRLRTWLDENRENWMLLAAVRQQAKVWDKRDNKDGDLPRWGERLQQAEALFGSDRFSQSGLELEFLSKAKALAEREQQEKEAQDRREREALEKAIEAQRGKTRASRIGLGVAIVLFLGAVFFGIWAYRSEQKAVDAKKEAVIAKDEAIVAKEKVEIAKNKAIKESERAAEKERKAFHQLAITHWNNAANNYQDDPLKAAHYFALASQTFYTSEDHEAVANANLAIKLILSNFKLRTIIEHNKEVNGASMSKDGRKILTWSADGTSRLWDSRTGVSLISPLVHEQGVHRAIFNSDETTILTWGLSFLGEGGFTARLWDAMTGDAITPPLKHNGTVFGAKFNGSDRILTWSADGAARLWDAKTGGLITKPFEHKEGFTGSAVRGSLFTIDEGRILTWGDDGYARLWDVESSEEVIESLEHEFVKNSEQVLGAVFNFDESKILTWGDDGTARLWSSSTGKPCCPPLEHDDRVYGAQFYANDSRILTWSVDGTSRVWNSKTCDPLKKFDHREAIRGVALSANESRVLTWSADGTAQIWNNDQTYRWMPSFQHSKEIFHSAFVANEDRVITYSTDGEARVWDSWTGSAITPTFEHGWGRLIKNTQVNNDGSKILTRSFGGTSIQVRDGLTSVPILPRLQHGGEVSGAVFISDDRQILTWSKDGMVRIWAIENDRPIATGVKSWGIDTPPDSRVRGKDDKSTAEPSEVDNWIVNWDKPSQDMGIGIQPSPDRSSFLTLSMGRTDVAQGWDSRTGQRMTTYKTNWPDEVEGWGYDADENWTMVWGRDGMVYIWNIWTGEELVRPYKPQGGVLGGVFNSDTGLVLTWNMDGPAHVWDHQMGKDIVLFKQGEEIWGGVFDPNGSRVLTWDYSGLLRVWNGRTGESLISLKPRATIRGAVFSNDGSRILAWGEGPPDLEYGYAHLFNSETGRELILPLIHDKYINGALFNADGSQILTWGKDNRARLWDSITGDESVPPLGHDDEVIGASFSPDESRILTWSSDQTVRLWDSRTGVPLARPFRHDGSVRKAWFNSDGNGIQTWSSTEDIEVVRLRDISIDNKWPPDQLVLKTEVETGTELTSTGELKALSATAWQYKKWCKYDKILHDIDEKHNNLKRIKPKQWQTSQRLCEEIKKQRISASSTKSLPSKL